MFDLDALEEFNTRLDAVMQFSRDAQADAQRAVAYSRAMRASVRNSDGAGILEAPTCPFMGRRADG